MSKHHFDIINSPEAETFLRMVTKGFYNNSYIGLWMYEVIGTEWDEMKAWAVGMKKEINPQTCTWSIGIWEWVYGIETDETLSLEYRRQIILAKVLETKPVNPETIRRGVARITGCAVDIVDFAEPYRFALKIHMLEDGDIIPYESVREYIRTVKPSHLAAFLTWMFLVVINNTQLEQFLNPWIWLHWRIPFWNCYVLDGTHVLDGSILLDAKRRYDLRIGLAFLMSLRTDCLDDSLKLNIIFLLKLKADELENAGNFSTSMAVTINFLNEQWYDNEAGIKISSAIEISESIGNIKVINQRNTYYLDGSVTMDGSRLLNAFYKEEGI